MEMADNPDLTDDDKATLVHIRMVTGHVFPSLNGNACCKNCQQLLGSYWRTNMHRLEDWIRCNPARIRPS